MTELPFDEIDPDTFDLAAQLKEAKREAAMRRNVYAGWVKQGRLKPGDAARQLGAMIAVVRTLERLAEFERAQQ